MGPLHLCEPGAAMTWFKGNERVVGHTCKTPPTIFHSTVRLTENAKWQCPECFRVYEAAHEWRFRDNNYSSKLFIEHKLGDNDYWYFFGLDED
jgi:hypothetical protein